MNDVSKLGRIIETYVHLRGIPQVITLQLDPSRYLRFKIPRLSSFRRGVDLQRTNVEMGGIPGSPRKYLISYSILFYIGFAVEIIMHAYAAMRRAVSRGRVMSLYKTQLLALLNGDQSRDLIRELSNLDLKDRTISEIEEIVVGEIDTAHSDVFQQLKDRVNVHYTGIDLIRELLSAEDDLLIYYGLQLARSYVREEALAPALLNYYLHRVRGRADTTDFNRKLAAELLSAKQVSPEIPAKPSR